MNEKIFVYKWLVFAIVGIILCAIISKTKKDKFRDYIDRVLGTGYFMTIFFMIAIYFKLI